MSSSNNFEYFSISSSGIEPVWTLLRNCFPSGFGNPLAELSCFRMDLLIIFDPFCLSSSKLFRFDESISFAFAVGSFDLFSMSLFNLVSSSWSGLGNM